MIRNKINKNQQWFAHPDFIIQLQQSQSSIYSGMRKNIILFEEDSRQRLPKFQALVQDRMAEIGHLFAEIDKTTDQFDNKLSRVIQFNQKQFICSYQNHMMQVKEELAFLRNQLQEKDKLISMYQTEGVVSDLLKRINFLEVEQSKLLKSLLRKDEQIMILRTQSKIDQSEKRKLEERIKDFSKEKPRSHQKLVNINKNYQSTQTISTQVIAQEKSPTKERLFFPSNDSKMKKIKFMPTLKTNKHANSIISDIDQDNQNSQLKKLQKKVGILEKEGKKLKEDNARISKEYQDAEKFFISLVNEMRKDIRSRKKIKYCSFEDFLKEDKISLLIKILSNTQLLQLLYHSIFSGSASNQPGSSHVENKISRNI